MLCPFHCKARPSGSSLQCPPLENIPQVPRNPDEVGQNHDAPKAASATLSVLKWSGALFRPRSSKVSASKNFLRLFHCKPRPSAVSLESPRQQYNSQFPENREDVSQNHDACKTVLASLSVLKWSAAIFRPRSSKVSVEKVLLYPFSMQTKAIKGYLRVFGTWKYPPSSGKFSRSWSKSRCALGGLAYCLSLKVKWGFIPAQELESERSKSFPVFIWLQTKAITS